MLSKLRIKNFKSIIDLELDLSFAEGKAPNNYKKLEILPFLNPTTRTQDRLVPVMNVYGANSSGKSNIIESIWIIQRILNPRIVNFNSFYKPNKLISSKEDYTTNELEFFIDKTKYKYVLSYNAKGIIEEALYKKEQVLFFIKDVKKFNFKNIQNKLYNEKDLKELFKIACINQEENIQIKTFLFFILDKAYNFNKDLRKCYDFLTKKMIVGNNKVPWSVAIDYLSETQKEEDINKAFERISFFIKERLDINIEKFTYNREKEDIDKYKVKDKEEKEVYILPNDKKIRKIDVNNNKIIFQDEISTFHKNERGKLVKFNFTDESQGTRLSFGLVGVILKTLEQGGVFIVDELDRSLHPLLLKILIKMFKDKDYNKNNAQVIATLHSSDILEDSTFRVSEFAFVNKTLKKGSTITRLCEMETRNDLNNRKRYLKGIYLGVPYPYL